MISFIINTIQDLLNFNTVIGLIVILLCVLAVVLIARRLWRPFIIIVIVLVILQICYILGQSALDSYIPFSTIFTTDIFGDISHLFTGTVIGNVFGNISNVMCNIGGTAAQYITNFMGAFDLI